MRLRDVQMTAVVEFKYISKASKGKNGPMQLEYGLLHRLPWKLNLSHGKDNVETGKGKKKPIS